MKRDTHLQAPGPACIKCGFVREFMLLPDRELRGYTGVDK